MSYMRFLPQIIIVYSKKKRGFDCKNNHGHSKLANFQLDIINKISYKMLIVILYILSKLNSNKI